MGGCEAGKPLSESPVGMRGHFWHSPSVPKLTIGGGVGLDAPEGAWFWACYLFHSRLPKRVGGDGLTVGITSSTWGINLTLKGCGGDWNHLFIQVLGAILQDSRAGVGGWWGCMSLPWWPLLDSRRWVMMITPTVEAGLGAIGDILMILLYWHTRSTPPLSLHSTQSHGLISWVTHILTAEWSDTPSLMPF